MTTQLRFVSVVTGPYLTSTQQNGRITRATQRAATYCRSPCFKPIFLGKIKGQFYCRVFLVIRVIQSIRFWRTFHLWLSLLLSLQLLAWFGSGLVMSVLPIEEVRGEHLRAPVPAMEWPQALLSPAELSQQSGLNTGLISLKQRGSAPVYQLEQEGHHHYFNAVTGSPLQALSEPELRLLAQQGYQGAGSLKAATLLTELPLEARGLKTPVWQVQFADVDNTVFYLDPMLGQVLRVRTDNWRVFDFVWMLHIMDYEERDDFNHGLLIASSALALLFTLSGFVLLVLTLRRQLNRSRPALRGQSLQ